jgi:hypothetical protein
VQIVFSLNPGLGGILTFNSYNKFNNNCHRDSIFVVLVNCGTSLLAGFVVFAYLGFMAHNGGLTDVSDVAEGGIGLVFQVFPEIFTKMGASPVPQIISFLFFFMMVTLGFGSIFGLVETVSACIKDYFTRLNKSLVVVVTCVLSFIFGLSICSKGGYLMLQLLNNNVVAWNTLVVIALEIVVVVWIYGAENFFGNIEEMEVKIPKAMKVYWKACWYVITPLVLSVLVVSSFQGQGAATSDAFTRTGTEWMSTMTGVDNIRMHKIEDSLNGNVIDTKTEGTYEVDGITYSFQVDGDTDKTSVSYVWPDGSEPGQPNIQALGWLIVLSSVLLIPAIGLYEICKRAYHGEEWRGCVMFQPTKNWKTNKGSDKTGEEQENMLGQEMRSPIIKRQLSSDGC